jgi:DNA excision repair protein ERCC-8
VCFVNRAVNNFEGHRDAILAVSWSPTNDYVLATGSMDNTVRLWDIRKAGYILSLDQYDTPDVTTQNKKHKILVNRVSTATAHTGAVTGLRFTPDGRNLLTTGIFTGNNLVMWQEPIIE